MLNRKVKVEARAESGAIGEVRHEGEHTFITHIKVKNYLFLIGTRLPEVPAVLAHPVSIDEQELDALLLHIFRRRDLFYRALNKLEPAERDEILGQYYKGKK